MSTNCIAAPKANLTTQENKIVTLYSKLYSMIDEGYDSLEYYSKKFESAMIDFIRTNPSTLNYPFKKLIDSNYCFIKTSGDGNFRYYSWDTWTGGSMHVFKELIQWKSNHKVFMKVLEGEDGDEGCFCSSVITVLLNNEPHYLAIRNGIYSNKDAMQSVYAYKIDNNKLNDNVKVFKTKTKMLNHIEVNFDFFSVEDHSERPLELIYYNNPKRTLYIPVVDEKGQLTKKYILYKLNNHCFEYAGIEIGSRK